MNRRRGFTLLEVLIAIMIVVILVGTMAETISAAFQLKQVSEDAVAAVRDTQMVGDVWVRDLADAVPPNPLDAANTSDPGILGGLMNNNSNNSDQIYGTDVADGFTTLPPADASTSLGGINGLGTNGGTSTGAGYLFGAFNGDNASMAFYTTGPEPKADIQGDVRFVQFKLASQDDGRQALVRCVDTNLLADDPNPNPPQQVLVTGVTQVAFTYFDGTNWLAAWDSTANYNTLPLAVKMVLTLEPVHPGGKPRLITRVATLWCATKTVNDANVIDQATQNYDSTTTTTGN